MTRQILLQMETGLGILWANRTFFKICGFLAKISKYHKDTDTLTSALAILQI
jgi:hypothetical protein